MTDKDIPTIVRADLLTREDQLSAKLKDAGPGLASFASGGDSKKESKRLGDVLRDRGLLDEAQISEISSFQEQHQVSFGTAAKRLGFVREDAVKQALATQFGYPLVPLTDHTLGAELITAYKTDSPYAESLRRLRSDLVAKSNNARPLALAVVSPRIRDGRTHLVGNLAVVFAQMGKNVLVIDADLRRPRLQELFKVPNEVGMSLVLSGRECPDPVQGVAHFERLKVLTAGPLPPNPHELVSSDRMRDMLTAAKRHYDVILIDTPPATSYSDAENISTIVGSALVVARRNRTKLVELIELSRRLKAKKVNVLGTLLVS
jgi:protein-tyrosine kinase